MPICPHCGQEIEPGSESCSACGKSLITPEKPAIAASVPELPIGEVKIGDYFKAGWELFKKYPAGFIGYSIVIMVISIIFQFVQFVPVIVWLAGLALASPLNAGFFVVGAKLLKKQTPQFADFLGGFKFFLQLALLGVVSGVLISIGLILLIFPGIYLIVSYLFALMFVVDRGLNFWTAMETSRRSVQTRWFAIFSLWILIVLLFLCPLLLSGLVWLAIVSFRNILFSFLVLLIIPLGLVTVPLSNCILTVAYADIFGLKSAYKISMRA